MTGLLRRNASDAEVLIRCGVAKGFALALRSLSTWYDAIELNVAWRDSSSSISSSEKPEMLVLEGTGELYRSGVIERLFRGTLL